MDMDRGRKKKMGSQMGSPKSLVDIGRLQTDIAEDGGLSSSCLGCMFG